MALQHQDWTDRLFALFAQACEHGGVFHPWMHSEKLEKLNAWRPLGAFLSHVSAGLEDGTSLPNLHVSQQG